jgi:hypothetical protein
MVRAILSIQSSRRRNGEGSERGNEEEREMNNDSTIATIKDLLQSVNCEQEMIELVARIVRKFYLALVAEGFSKEEATYIIANSKFGGLK